MPQNATATITIDTVTSPEDLAQCFAIRREVFVDEQGVDPALEFDNADSKFQAFLARDGKVPIGTIRITMSDDPAKIGRLAVLRPWRKMGVGRALMERAIAFAAKRGVTAITLHAQTAAAEFYKSLGFEIYGAEFMEAGIAHVEMQRDPGSAPSASGVSNQPPRANRGSQC